MFAGRKRTTRRRRQRRRPPKVMYDAAESTHSHTYTSLSNLVSDETYGLSCTAQHVDSPVVCNGL